MYVYSFIVRTYKNVKKAPSGFEPLHEGFADLSLTTWVRRRVQHKIAENLFMFKIVWYLSLQVNSMNNKISVLLMQPPIYDFALFDLFFKPYGLLRIAGWLAAEDYELHYLNALDWHDERSVRAFGQVKRKSNGTGKFFRQQSDLPDGFAVSIPRQYSRYGIHPESILEQVRAARPEIVFITTGMTYWYEGVLEAVRAVRACAPQAKILLGGIYATLMPEHAAGITGADAVICGDGEGQLRSILETWGYPVPSVPIPSEPLLLKEAWEGPAGAIRLNTGCPLHCDYCASDRISPRFRQGDPDQSFAFLMESRRRFGITNIGFYDDALLMNSDRVFKPFLERVIASGLPWSFYTPNAVHIKLIDAETACLMKRAGFQEVRMGFESSSEQFHEEHDHKFCYDDFHHAVGCLHRAGFTSKQLPVYILAGLPGQHKASVLRSIAEAERARVGASIAEFSPVPGTPAWEYTLQHCSYPLDSEPLYHNNSLQVTAWEGFTRDDMHEVKSRARMSRV